MKYLFSLAVCDPECVNGICTNPDNCACDIGWIGDIWNIGEYCCTDYNGNSCYFQNIFYIRGFHIYFKEIHIHGYSLFY